MAGMRLESFLNDYIVPPLAIIVIGWLIFRHFLEDVVSRKTFEEKVQAKIERDFGAFADEEIREFAFNAWRHPLAMEEKKVGKKVYLKEVVCLDCKNRVSSASPIAAIDDGVTYTLEYSWRCKKCHLDQNSSHYTASLWEGNGLNNIMKSEDEPKYAKWQLALANALIFTSIWIVVAFGAYALTFVPWFEIMVKTWTVFLEALYIVTRWWSIVGLMVALCIAYLANKENIDAIYHRYANTLRARRRYKNLKSKKDKLQEDEVREFVNEMNGENSNG